MFKRLICLLCVFVLCFSCAAAEEEKPSAQRYDFDLTFSLNPDAVPARSRSRARGYAELLDNLELRGDIVVCDATQSFDMNAVLFFKSKPDVSIPFRFYGVPALLFLTSPIIGNETLLFNMGSLAEFAIKIRKSLETPLPALALLYPFVYQYNFWNIWQAWNRYTGPGNTSREISAEQIGALADSWMESLASDPYVNAWMTALYSVSSAPEAVEAELNAIPAYLREFVSLGGPLTVRMEGGSETWLNAEGTTLFQSEKSDGSVMWSLTLPSDENRYTPVLDYSAKKSDGSFSFSLDGSMFRGKAVLPPGISEEDFSPVTGSDEEEYGGIEGEGYPSAGSGSESEGEYGDDEVSYEDEEDAQWPKTMLLLNVSGDSLPASLPSDSSFSLTASVKGALYPNFDLKVQGKTEKDGSFSVFISNPKEEADAAALLSLQGTIVPGAAAETVPDFNYTPEQLYGNYNFFSFSEYYVAKFKNAVTRPLLKGLLDFVAAAPTAACQSFLDDLTDSGILNMMMDQ